MKIIIVIVIVNRLLTILDEAFKCATDIWRSYSYIPCPNDAVYAATKAYILSLSKGVNKNGSFISGDTYSNIFKPNIAFNACNFKTLDASIENLKQCGIVTVYPGHGVPFEFNKIKR